MKTIEQLILEGSNPFQAQVINNRSKELIVPAGAGSGKTKTLVTKMIEIIEDGASLDDFLVLTFTKKAASEMKERIKKILLKGKFSHLANKVDSAYVSTFDAYAYNFVKQHAAKIGLDSNIELLDSAVFNITKTEIMEELILNYMISASPDINEMLFDFTEKKSSQKLIMNLINFHTKLTNEFKLDQINANDLIKPIKFIDIDEVIDKLRDIDDEFYFDENNQVILDAYFNYARYLNGELMEAPTFPAKKMNWKMFDDSVKEIYKKKINNLIDPIKKLIKENVNRESVIKVQNYKQKYAVILLEIIKKFDEKLNEFKLKANKYEFNDISSFLNRILKENIDVRNRLKDQFKYIFVDEYQDTSSVQSEFLNLLIDDNEHIHVMYVGDIKQSIYKFRNAKPETFIQKQKEADVISLNTNYRSHKKIIDFVNEIFIRILNDSNKYDINYNENHAMLSGSIKYKDDKLPGVYLEELYNDPDFKQDSAEEAFVVGNKILALVNSGLVKNYSEVAILARNTTNFKSFIDVFNYLGIPLQVQVSMNLNQTYLLKLMANILLLAKNLHIHDKNTQDIKRFTYASIARSEIFKLKDFEILNDLVDIEFKKEKTKILDIDKNIYHKLNTLNKVIYSKGNLDIVYSMLETFNIYERIIETVDSDQKHFQIDYLINLCQPMSDLGIVGEDFVEYFYKIAYDESKLELSILQESSENSVKMTNIHQSKGLEYEVLFCVGLNKSFGMKIVPEIKFSNDNLLELYPKYELDNDKSKLKLIDSIFKKNYQEVESKSQLKEELRLLYVAFTRAEKALFLVTTKNEDHSNLNSFADYLYEHDFEDLIPKENITRRTAYETTKSFRDQLKEQMYYYPNQLDKLKSFDKTFNYEKIEKKKASLEINTLLSEDAKKSILQGNKLHEKFEYMDVNSNDLQLSKFLNTSFNNQLIKDAKEIIHEYEFIDFEGEKEINGKIDLIVIYEDQVHIIDYKTKDISIDKYKNQLLTYRNFLSKLYKLPIYTYLYSIAANKVNEVKYD